ncbi:MAG: outer membrane protein assembly factor BamD [Bacteroidales bacterium]|jgi:outer membrane protein assembly factor BamD|nr:outer membrane protein assembly factor BamD [Bacteroidales bacterium]
MKVRLYIISLLLVILCSCSGYNKLLKSTDYELKKTKALEFYAETKYVKTTELLRQILARYRGTEEGEELNWINARSYYGMKDYMMAGMQFQQFIDQFPFGTHTEEAYYFVAYCDFLLSPRPELDQEYTRNAIEGFNLFITKYPNSPRAEECRGYITDLENRLVEKNYKSARLYYDMKEYKAATVAINNSLNVYANTKYREEMMFLKLNSLYLYAVNSLPAMQRTRYQDTLDDYFSFIEEYPDSRYARDVMSIYERTERYLKGSIPTNDNNYDGLQENDSTGVNRNTRP